jgi:hypothetical protein
MTMTFKYTTIAYYPEGPDGPGIVAHEHEAESLAVAVDTLQAIKDSDSDIQYVVIVEHGFSHPCWDTRYGAVEQPEPAE